MAREDLRSVEDLIWDAVADVDDTTEYAAWVALSGQLGQTVYTLKQKFKRMCEEKGYR